MKSFEQLMSTQSSRDMNDIDSLLEKQVALVEALRENLSQIVDYANEAVMERYKERGNEQ
jgi:hypothetical protein